MTNHRWIAWALVLLTLLALFGCHPSRPVPENQQAGWGNARWVWKDDTVKNNDWAAFKRSFTLDTVPETAKVKIACDSKYWLWANGEAIVRDGGIKRGATYYDTVDLAPYLQAGENDLAILVWYWGPGSETTHYGSSGTAGLIVSTDLIDSKSKQIVETGDGTWFASAAPGYSAGGRGENAYLGEQSIVFDAQTAGDWTSAALDPAGSGWQKAVTVGRDKEEPGYAGDRPWGELIARPIPQWNDYGLTTFTAAELVKDGSTYTIRLPYNMQIFPYLELGDATEAGKTVTAYTETYPLSLLNTQYTTKAGAQAYESVGWINGDFLCFNVPDGVEIVRLGYRQTGYGIEIDADGAFLGSFASDGAGTDGFTGGWFQSGNFYDELWQKATVSLYVCMRDTYMDCPDRERGQYIGDAINEIEEAFYALGPAANALSAKAIREICAGQVSYEYSGKTYYAMSSLEPIAVMHEIPLQELGTAVAAWDYYLFTGDASVPQDCFTALYRYLTNYRFETSGAYEGTIRMRSAEQLKNTYHLQTSRLDQWSDWGNNQDTRIAVNCWWYLSAAAVRNMADIDGVDVTQEQLAWLDESIARVEQNFPKFWNESLHAYATEWGDAWYNPVQAADGSHLVDERVNALAVVAGLADESYYPALREVFEHFENASIYMEKYVLEALYQMGYAEDAMARMERRQLAIVNDPNASTLPELWHDSGVTDFPTTRERRTTAGRAAV